ncbi:MAG: tetratricopeptide repeat protein [Myxococcales bacterium]
MVARRRRETSSAPAARPSSTPTSCSKTRSRRASRRWSARSCRRRRRASSARRPSRPRKLKGPKKTARGNTRTRVFIIPFEVTDVPVVVAGLDLKNQTLSTFEAFALSMVDGRSSLDSLRHALSLGKIEIQTLAVSLVERKLIRMLPPEALPPPPAPKRKAEPPPSPAPYPPPLLEPHELPPAVTEEHDLRSGPPVPLHDGPLPEIKRVVPPGLARPFRREAPPPAPKPEPSKPEPKRALEEVRPRGPVPEHVYQSPLQKAITLEKEGRMQECIAHLERAISVSSDPAPLYNRLALVLLKERRDLKGAEALLHKALEHDPDSDVYRQNLLKILMMTGATTGKKKVPRR